MSVFGLNSYPGNSTSGDSIVVQTVKKKIVLAECGCLSVKVQPTVVAWHGWCGSDTGQCARPSMSARCLDAGPTWKAVDDRKINKKKNRRRRRRRTRSRIPTPGVSHWLVLSRPCHKAALTVRKTHFVHVDIKAKTGISIAAAGSTFIHHLRNQDQGHLSADHSDNDLLPSCVGQQSEEYPDKKTVNSRLKIYPSMLTRFQLNSQHSRAESKRVDQVCTNSMHR
ncbi:hypothetical protein T10_942 [Trichinella papuae]|uniref:Uncharacterized protein n=1 Tax=Trichinella papuae TaxID=268474 RepID=A0A0V1MZH9_9BILA|nr:hypothetical protein T10_942 [Trichinella papuae]